MKHIKSYQQVNEEISFKGLATAIASLFLTFGSLDLNAFPSAAGGARRRDAEFASQVNKLSHKLHYDLKQLKSQTEDPQLQEIINLVIHLESQQDEQKIQIVLDKISEYIQSNQIEEEIISDTLHHISISDYEAMKADYQELLSTYESYQDEIHFDQKILIVVLMLAAIISIILGVKVISTFRGGGF